MEVALWGCFYCLCPEVIRGTNVHFLLATTSPWFPIMQGAVTVTHPRVPGEGKWTGYCEHRSAGLLLHLTLKLFKLPVLSKVVNGDRRYFSKDSS